MAAEAAAKAAQMATTAAGATTALNTDQLLHKTKRTGSRQPAQTTSRTEDAQTATTGKGQMPTPPSGTIDHKNPAQDEDPHNDILD